MLQGRGLKAGEKPDLMNMSSPDAVEEVHRLYIEAGSDIICTNTLGSSAFGLRNTGYSPEEVITAAVGIAKRARIAANRDEVSIALDIGPIGEFLEPVGDLEPEAAYEMFAQQAIAGKKAGADFAAIETMSDLGEMEIAVRAVIDSTSLPVLATMTFDKRGYTFMGCAVERFAEMAESMGVSAAGINCSHEPDEMFDVARRFLSVSGLPFIAKLNAGLPVGNEGAYSVGPEEFARQMEQYASIGVKIVGGCCGTTPEHIRALKGLFS